MTAHTHPLGTGSAEAPPAAHSGADTDLALAERMRARDRQALAELYDRYASVALATALRVLGDRQSAEDAVHDAFVIVWQKVDGFRPERGTLRGWLMTIVRNRAIDRRRSTRTAVDLVEADALALTSTGANPVWEAVAERLSVQMLRSAVDALPTEQRRAVELAYFGGLTYREVAARTGVPVGTANGRLRLALAKLREALAARDARAESVQRSAAGDRGRATVARPAGAALEATEHLRREAKTILVVDDDPVVRETLTEVLEHEGFVARAASSGRAAVDQLMAGLRPCLIILDLAMPVMDGVEFARWLSEADGLRDIPFLISSGHKLPEEAPLLDRAEAVLPKPAPIADLLAAIERRCVGGAAA